MDWNSSALLGIIGLIGGIVISAFFYFLGIKRKSLVYDITTTTLVSENATQIEKLNITYNDKLIKNLYTSTIEIKNNSNSIIELNDFAPSVPLSLITNGEFLVSSDIGVKLFSKNIDNNVYPLFEVDENNMCQKVIIHFDYISKKETISCTVFHTNSLSVSVNGKLKDGKLKNIENSYRQRQIVTAVISACISALITSLFALSIQHFRG